MSTVVLIDTSFYAAITPLLPYYADQHDLTKVGAGVLAAAYAAGTVAASLPAAWLARQIGAQRTIALGLLLISVSSLTFGLANEVWLLDTARFVQGAGGAATWTAGLGLLTAAAPTERRAEILGTAFAAAVAGAVLGPVVGAVAREVGTEPTFTAIAVLAASLLVISLRPEFGVADGRAGAVEGGFMDAIRQRQIARGAGIIAISGLAFGVLDVLLPLKMGALGASGAVIAGAFIGATILETILSPRLGRFVDRGQSERIAFFGLLFAASLSVLASLPDSVAGLFVVGVAAGPLIGGLWIPGLAWLAEGSEHANVEYAYATDFVPYAVVAAIALLTAIAITQTRRKVPGAIAAFDDLQH